MPVLDRQKQRPRATACLLAVPEQGIPITLLTCKSANTTSPLIQSATIAQYPPIVAFAQGLAAEFLERMKVFGEKFNSSTFYEPEGSAAHEARQDGPGNVSRFLD